VANLEEVVIAHPDESDPWYDQFSAWLDTRPDVVKELAITVPPRSYLVIDGSQYWVCGYTEEDSFIISGTDPAEDYETAMENREYIHADHVRDFLREGGGWGMKP
jgi:hypothetical protein